MEWSSVSNTLLRSRNIPAVWSFLSIAFVIISYKLLISIYVECFLRSQIDLGWDFVICNKSPDLKTGLTLAIFNFDGTIPVDKEQLKIWIRTSMISGIICFNKFELIPSTPLLVLGFNDDVILRTSSLVHGIKNSESGGESDDKIC